MAEMEFRELRGEYVANTGQTINLREYLDYFEPLGSALSRLPDGAGGPFVHQFTDSGGRTIGSIGWVVSAASKRFGAWTLWGMWSDHAIPAVALPLFWSALSDPARTSDLVGRANKESARLADRRRWPELLDDVKTIRLHEESIRESLKTELARVWAAPPPHRHSIEVEVTPRMLDILPWIYILGPVDPASAQIQPSRFNGAGYQYILDEHHPAARDVAAIAVDVGELVDTAASDVVAAWQMANELRARRSRPKRAEKPRPRTQPVEIDDMRKESSSTRGTTPLPVAQALKVLYRVAVLALLTWIAINVHMMRKAAIAERTPAVAVSETVPLDDIKPQPAPAQAEDLTRARVARIANALSARPPRGIRVSDPVLKDIAQGGADASDKLARVAIEVYLRRSGCFARAEVVDGKFSATEQRAIRGCALLQDERLMKNSTQPDPERAIKWLQGIVGVDTAT